MHLGVLNEEQIRADSLKLLNMSTFVNLLNLADRLLLESQPN